MLMKFYFVSSLSLCKQFSDAAITKNASASWLFYWSNRQAQALSGMNPLKTLLAACCLLPMTNLVEKKASLRWLQVIARSSMFTSPPGHMTIAEVSNARVLDNTSNAIMQSTILPLYYSSYKKPFGLLCEF